MEHAAFIICCAAVTPRFCILLGAFRHAVAQQLLACSNAVAKPPLYKGNGVNCAQLLLLLLLAPRWKAQMPAADGAWYSMLARLVPTSVTPVSCCSY